MDYEWDDAKAATNMVKHGIDFLDTINALTDPRRIEEVDDGPAYGEERIRTIGIARGNILFVVTTLRDENLCRIISARKATRHEQDRHYAGTH